MKGGSVVLHSGVVWTGCPEQPFAEAVAVERGRVVAVGADEAVREAMPRPDEAVDLKGRFVLPGFQDAHCHPRNGGWQRRSCDLGDALTLAEVREAIAGYVARHPGGGWVTGKGWSMETFPNGIPPASLLDELVGERPAFLVNRDGHSAWVSSAALRLAGIDASTPDPPDGRIERELSGAPQGTLHEGAMELVRRLMPPETPADVVADLEAGIGHLLSLGVTAWQDAIVTEDILAAYEHLAAQRRLGGRPRLALWWARERGVDQLEELVALRDRAAAAGLDAGSAKVMLDGVMETYTAALLEPYEDPCGDGRAAAAGRGTLFFEPEAAAEAVTALAGACFQVHFHAIGDRAVRVALDAVEASVRVHGGASRRLRHHVAHIQLVHPDDVARFHALGVIANAQPYWACYEPQMTELTLPFLGPTRAGWQYPFRSLTDAGSLLCFGSDWPVSTANPLEEIAVAVRRALPSPSSDGAGAEEPFLPGERLGLEESLRAFTAGSAYVNHREAETGTVAPGKRADLVVLEADPFRVGAAELHRVGVEFTMVDGSVVYESG